MLNMDWVLDGIGLCGVSGLPAGAARVATDAFIDTIGCIVAGAEEAPARRVLDFVRQEHGFGPCSALGTATKMNAGNAALFNGTAGHSMDFDDISPAMMGHASVVMIPALLALAQLNTVSGAEMLRAYVAGFECAGRIGRLVNPDHYKRGWHATGTLGAFAAAAASAHLIGLSRERAGAAIGIAASQSAGLRRNFGTDVKPLHAGLAARAGLSAALLARAGVTASSDVLSGPGGFYDVYAGRGDAEAPQEGAFALEIEATGLTVKRHSCCGCAHQGVDAALDLRGALIGGTEEIDSAVCRVNTWAPRVLTFHQAETPMEAKFCMEYCVAVSLIDGACGPAQFRTERVRAADVQALLSRIEVVVDEELPPIVGSSPVDLLIRMRSGKEFHTTVDTPVGTPERPLAAADLEQKFLDCCRPKLGDSRSSELLGKLRAMASSDDFGAILALAA